MLSGFGLGFGLMIGFVGSFHLCAFLGIIPKPPNELEEEVYEKIQLEPNSEAKLTDN
jgi:hypothetical protein